MANNKVNFQNQAELFKACFRNDLHAIKSLLENWRHYQVDANATYNLLEYGYLMPNTLKYPSFFDEGGSCLMFAVYNAVKSRPTGGNMEQRVRRLEICRLLIERYCADWEARTSQGWTALLMASWYGLEDIVDYLITFAGPDILLKQRTDDYGRNALMLACRWGQVRVVKLLLTKYRYNVYPKQRDRLGMTPLILACQRLTPQNAEVVYELLTNGNIDNCERINMTDNGDRTALDWVQIMLYEKPGLNYDKLTVAYKMASMIRRCCNEQPKRN